MTLSELIYLVKELEKEAEEIEKKVTSWLSYNFTFAYVNELNTKTLWMEESFREEQRKCIRALEMI